jgi:hypothetical protein
MKVYKKGEATPAEAEAPVKKAKPASTAVVAAPASGNLPALPGEWANKLAEHAKDESAKETPETQAFSLRAGVLSFNGQPMPDNKMRVVVAASAFENALFISKFDPNNIVSPLCFALAENDEDLKPHDNSFKKQGGEDGMCLGCEHAEWGSDPNSPSGRGKACKSVRRLGLIPEDALFEGLSKAQVAMLRVPVTSVANWATYVHTLAATAKRPVWSVVTEITVKPDPKKQFTVNFEAVDAINDGAMLDEMSDVRRRAAQAISVPYGMMTEEQYKAITEEEEKPKAKRKF